MEEEQLLIPKEQVTKEVLCILAANGFFKIVSSNEQEIEDTTLCVCKFSTPHDLASLKRCCESGKEILLLPQNDPLLLLDLQSAEALLASFNYVISDGTSAVMLGDSGDSTPHRYYTKSFDEQLQINLQPEYFSKGKRSGIRLSDYAVKYKSLTFNVEKKIIQTSFKPAHGVFPEQKLAVGIEIDMFGSSDHSILMDVASFRVGTVKAGFCENDRYFGYYPDRIKLFIEPKHPDGPVACIPALVVPDDKLGEVSYNITKEKTLEIKHQAGLDVGISLLGIATLTTKAGEERLIKEPETVAGASLTPIFEGNNTQIFEWNLETWGDGGSYRREKPHVGMKGEWRKLPYRGTGPIITRMNRIRWKIPEQSLLANLSFELTIETMMVLLEKKPADWNLCGLINLATLKSTRTQVTHKAVFKLQQE